MSGASVVAGGDTGFTGEPVTAAAGAAPWWHVISAGYQLGSLAYSFGRAAVAGRASAAASGSSRETVKAVMVALAAGNWGEDPLFDRLRMFGGSVVCTHGFYRTITVQAGYIVTVHA